MYRLTARYLYPVLFCICTYKVMYLTSNQIKSYPSLIFAATNKPATHTTTTIKPGMSKYINHEGINFTYSVRIIYVEENGVTQD